MTELDYENLPDDPNLAFVKLVGHFDEVLRVETENAGYNDDTRLYLIRHMNSILGAARALDITTFNSWDVAEWDNVYSEHPKFDLAVKNLVIQINIRSARVGRVYSVQLDTPTKERIHHLCKKIREAINSSDLDERKQNSLFSKLNAFEADVDRIRTRFDNILLALSDLAATAKSGAEALNPISDLVKRITELIGEAKNKEPETHQLPSPEKNKQIEPPRKQITDEKSHNLDDDIPF